MKTKFPLAHLTAGLVMLSVCPTLAQIGPLTPLSYNFEVLFHRSFGTIGADSDTNPPDPSWVMKVDNDTDDAPNDLVSTTPNVANPTAYCYAISTWNTGWHPVIDFLLYEGSGNVTGKFDYDVISYENDCTSQCIYNVGWGPCGGVDDFALRSNEGNIEFLFDPPGQYAHRVVNVHPDESASRVEFKYVWRYEAGTRAYPLDFGLITPGQGYGHDNHLNATLGSLGQYTNDWDATDDSAFSTMRDVTYTFQLDQSATVRFTITRDSSGGKTHIVSLDENGDFDQYQGFGLGQNFTGALNPGYYAVIVEGTSSDLGNFSLGILAQCGETQDLTLTGAALRSYETGGSINSNQQIVMRDILYDAGTEIELSSGFEVAPGQNFTAFIDGCGVEDIEGNSYRTVRIGNLEWMAENLRTSVFNDGSPITEVEEGWGSEATPAWCKFDNQPANEAIYGKLYNWYAVDPASNGNKNVCPEGWHVPDDQDWDHTRDFLGGFFEAGAKMKEIGTVHWDTPNDNANDQSGFTGLPGGWRSESGGFNFLRSEGDWWSATVFGTENANTRILLGGTVLTGSVRSRAVGASIRCVRD